MKKLLYLIPVLSLLLILTSCFNTNPIEKDIHDFHQAYDENNHYDICDCGEIRNIHQHEFTTPTIVKNATCEEDGLETQECIHCGYKKETVITKLGHDPIKLNGTPATCVDTGKTEGYKCQRCEKILDEQETLSKINHDFSDWTIDTPATCTNKGKEKRTCNYCHLEEYRDIEKKEHTPVSYQDKESTCQEHGHTGGSYCKDCKIELESKTVLPLGNHKYDIETVSKEPTLNEKGTKTYTCSVCGDSYEEELPRQALTQNIWRQSFTSESFNNSYIELTYMEDDEYLDIIFEMKNGITYARIYDHNTYKTYEYYSDTFEVIETYLDGYRHKLYKANEDVYLKYQNILASSIFNSSEAYDKVSYDEENGYYMAQEVETYNYNNVLEKAYVGIKLDNNGKLKEYAYSSDTCFINLQLIAQSPNIQVPDATHHHVVDGKCEICNLQYDTYEATKDDINLTYHVNKINKSVEFEYTSSKNLTFLNPVLTETDKYKQFTSLYYEGITPLINKTVKSYTINSNKVLKITYSDDSEECILLMKDNTALLVDSDGYSQDSYNGIILEQSFDLILKDKTVRYYIKDSNTIEVSEYKEINIYYINNMVLTDFNSRRLSTVLDKYNGASNATFHNGNKGTVNYEFDSSFNIKIYYFDSNGRTEPFNAIKFENLTGSSTWAGSDYYLYFMGDNEHYVLHYDNHITITKL